MEDYAEWFAERLRIALGDDMEQTELARLITENGFDMKAGRLGHYFQGRRYPDPPILKEIAKALGVSADWLLGLTEQQLPVAELEEMLARERGEGKINKLMRQLSREQQQQVVEYAEFLLTRKALTGIYTGATLLANSEAQKRERALRLDLAEATDILDSIEQNMGYIARVKVEEIMRGKGLTLNSTP